MEALIKQSEIVKKILVQLNSKKAVNFHFLREFWFRALIEQLFEDDREIKLD